MNNDKQGDKNKNAPQPAKGKDKQGQQAAPPKKDQQKPAAPRP